jgi:hypothetical protein
MSASEQILPQRPRVFISYSHDSAAHCDRVLAFAQQLRRDGIKAELDQFHQRELVHWPSWCAEQLRRENSKYVLCVCTAEYLGRVENRVDADVGKGVFWEGRLIYNYIYDAKENDRFIPVFLGAEGDDCVPLPLRGYTRFRLKTFQIKDGDPDYEGLYGLLTGQPARLMTEVGTLQKLPPLPQEARRTDFILLIQIKQDTEKILSILKDRAAPTSSENIALSLDAQALVKEMAKPGAGKMVYDVLLERLIVEIGESRFIGTRDPESIAFFEASVEELKRANLIARFGSVGNHFTLTRAGYLVAKDMLKGSTNEHTDN